MAGKKGAGKYMFTPEVLNMVETLAGLGLTQQEICSNLGITARTFITHKKENEQLREAMERGKAKAHCQVASVAMSMAKSGEHPQMTQFWLKTRAKHQWQEKVEIEHSGEIKGDENEDRKKADKLLADLLKNVAEAKKVEPLVIEGKIEEDE